MRAVGLNATQQLDDLVKREVVRQHAHDTAARILADREARRLWTPPVSRSGTEELALPDEPLVYTIDGMHMRGHNSLLASQYKAGKTTLMLNLVRSLADSVPFLGHKVTQSGGRIAMWNYEVDDRQYRDWFRRIGITNADNVELLHLRGRSMPLYTTLVRDWTVDWLRENQVTTWILDPAARAILGWPGVRETENSNSAVAEFLDTLDQIKLESGVEDLFIAHHTGRATHAAGEEHGRGATRWDDWPDTRWVLVKKDDVRYFYANGRGVDVPEFGLGFDPHTLRLGAVDGSREDKTARDDALSVVDAVRRIGDGHNKTEVKAAIMGVASDRKDTAIGTAQVLGWIEILRPGRAMEISVRHDHPDLAQIEIHCELEKTA